MTDNDIQQKIDQALNNRENYNAYNPSLIPNHIHSGSDSPRINYLDLENLPATDSLFSFLSPFRETDSSTMFSTDDFDNMVGFNNTLPTLEVVGGTAHYQVYNVTGTWAAADFIWGAIKQGDYVYGLFVDDGAAPDEYRIYRFDKDDIAAGGTLMTFAGTLPDLTTDRHLRMASDGTYFYINYNGGNSANAYVLAKYVVSGTELTYDSSITCGSATLGFDSNFAVTADGSIYTIDNTNDCISKFLKTGTLDYTDQTGALNVQLEKITNLENVLYAFDTTRYSFIKLFYT